MVRKVILILQTGGCLMARCYTYDAVIFAVLAGLIGMLGEVWLTRLSAPRASQSGGKFQCCNHRMVDRCAVVPAVSA